MLWIKIYPSKCLRGSLHFDLPYQLRGIWYELLLMAGDVDDDGLFEFPISFLASQLGCPVKVLEEVLVTLEKTERIVRDRNKILITNWHLHQKMKGEPHIIRRDKPETNQEWEKELARQKSHQDQVAKMSSEDLQIDAKRLGEEYDRLHPEGEPKMSDEALKEMREVIADKNTNPD